MCVCAHPYPTLWVPVDYTLPGSSVHGIFQARILSGLPFLNFSETGFSAGCQNESYTGYNWVNIRI